MLFDGGCAVTNECSFLHIGQSTLNNGLAKLASDHLHLQGQEPLHIHFNQIISFEPQPNSIRLDTKYGKIQLTLSDLQTKNWLKIITNSQSLEQKLGLQPHHKAALFGFIHPEVKQAVCNAVYAWASFPKEPSKSDIAMIPGRFDAIFVEYTPHVSSESDLKWQILLDCKNILWLAIKIETLIPDTFVAEFSEKNNLVLFHVVNLASSITLYGFISKKYIP